MLRSRRSSGYNSQSGPLSLYLSCIEVFSLLNEAIHIQDRSPGSWMFYMPVISENTLKRRHNQICALGIQVSPNPAKIKQYVFNSMLMLMLNISLSWIMIIYVYIMVMDITYYDIISYDILYDYLPTLDICFKI